MNEPQTSGTTSEAAPSSNAGAQAKEAAPSDRAASGSGVDGAGLGAAPGATPSAADTPAQPRAGVRPEANQKRMFKGLDSSFTVTEALSSFRFRLGIDEALWRAVVAALRTVLAPPLPGKCTGLIVSDERLLGLAAAELFAAPDIHVPLETPPSGHERLSNAVRMHHRPRDFLRKCRDLNAPDGPLLMLGWDVEHFDHATSVNLASPSFAQALQHGVICLTQADNVDAKVELGSLPTLLNVSDRALEIVMQTIRNLELPASLGVDDDRELERLVLDIHRTWPLEAILTSLNMPGHVDFVQRAWQSKSLDYARSSTLFHETVLDPKEESPREAACLFLVSHFARLTADQFVELGDELALETPAKQRPSNRIRQFDGITDEVLDRCNIRFTPVGRGSAIAELKGAQDGDGESEIDSAQHAAMLELMFKHEAPLLRERYIRLLEQRLTHGHTSDAIAQRFQRLELDGVRALVYEDHVVACDRLKRLVYGDLQKELTPRSDLSEAASVARHEMALRRSIERTPALILEFAGPSPDDRLLDVIRSLCSPDPTPDVALPRQMLADSAALLFWHLYAQYPRRITLDTYRSLFRSRTTDDDRARAALINHLRWLFHFAEPRERRPIQLAGFDSLSLLVILIDDVVRCFDRIEPTCPMDANAVLLVESCAYYLDRGLHGACWRDVERWSADESDDVTVEQRKIALIRRLSSGVSHWLDRTYVSRESLDTADDDEVLEEATTFWFITMEVADAVFGSSAFGAAETNALSWWLALQTGLDPNHPGTLPFNTLACWQSLLTPLSDQPLYFIAFRAAIQPLLAMLPVVVLMAMTCRGSASRETGATDATGPADFVFSDAMKAWLRGREESRTRARGLLARIEACWPLISNWQRIGKSQFEETDLERAKSMLGDRVSNLKAFAGCLMALG
ncbi:hypothetical protein AWB69_08973 [Caballeronia udeis]|uniref:Uncharacterized protein n=1 Tax=Caballeronia udeis TaxID=1232866 RepID=A0A158JXX2_9BURK|nr:hypothetical protein [Caballeronia udeis]SAL73279.1 hypothetical protein AWB69_08973 [Caballeronia udeis]